MARKRDLSAGFSPVPTADQPMSMPNQSSVLGGINQNRNKFGGGSSTPTIPNQLPATPSSPTTDAQKAAGQAFIQQRERLASRLLDAGITSNPEHARALASGQISGLAQENVGATFTQVPVGAESQARERAKSEVAGLGAAESTTPTQAQMNKEGLFTAVAIGATLFSLLKGKGAAITGESKLLRTGAIAGTATGIQRTRISAATAQFSNSKSLIDATTSAMENGMISWDDGMKIINEQMLNINRQERFLKSVTGDFVSDWLSGGKDNLADIQAFRVEFENITSLKLQQIGINTQAAQQVLG